MLQTCSRILPQILHSVGFSGPSGNTRTIGHSERSILIWLNVINALLLRDIRMRAGKFYIAGLSRCLLNLARQASKNKTYAAKLLRATA
jgi:hypothetical protein